MAAALVVVCSALATGCSEDIDQAQSVHTRLGRIDQVTTSDVSSPTESRGAVIEVEYSRGLVPGDVVRLVSDIAQVAEDERYLAYRLRLTETGAPDDVLVVDDSFAGDPEAKRVVDTWQRLSSALIGQLSYAYQPESETIDVDTDASMVYDVQEASRIGYGSALTTWRFTAADAVYIDEGKLRPQDVLLQQRVQRTVASPSLPLTAPGWRLETRNDHVLLDLPLVIPSGRVSPTAMTITRFQQPVRVLVTAAVDALDVTGKPLWLRLRHRSSAGNDVFGWWISDQRPVRGRDRLNRNWDDWLVVVAGRELAGKPS